MLVDTHCHLNMLVKKTFDTPLTKQECLNAHQFIEDAKNNGVTLILNVGTSLVESMNSIMLAKEYPEVYASVGIHPNDATESWRDELRTISKIIQNHHEHKIVAIGECGMDKHYPGYDLDRQRDAFKAQIELALAHDLALVIHNRDAGEETLAILEEYKNEPLRGTMHCFSEDLAFAKTVHAWGFALGIGGTITYPKNHLLRDVVTTMGLDTIILETDAPFLPPQHMRGKTNTPAQVNTIAEYVSNLLNISPELVALKTTQTALNLFKQMGER